MNIRYLKIFSFFMAFVLVSNTIVLAENSDSLQQQIDENKNNINKLEEEKNKVNSEIENQSIGLEEILNKINEKSKDLDEAKKNVAKFENQINDIQNSVNEIQLEIANTNFKIEEKIKLIEQKEEENKATEALLESRIVSYYKADMTGQYIYMIIRSKSISELISNIQNAIRIMNLDRDLINANKQVQKELMEEKDILAESIEKIKKDESQLLAKQNELKEAQKEFIVIQEKEQSQMDELMALENEKADLISALSDKEKELAHQIGDLASYNQELEAELDKIFADINNGNNQGGNSTENGEDIGKPSAEEDFLRPGYGVVTDPYGPRINPVTGEAGFHKGVDLGDPYGAPVRAAKSGVVEYAGWISGYGNTVIIDHGNGVQTLYAHNSSLQVQVGQTVSRGSTIALVGSTGQSTGPHIHWEIRINGKHTNPMGYV